MADTRQCPRAGCTKTISGDLFACSRHWYTVPGDTRDAIWRAWRAYTSGRGTLEQLNAAHAQAYAAWGQAGPE